MRILLVCGNHAVHEKYTSLLPDDHLDIFSSGQAALPSLSQKAYDLIFLDLDLSDTSGVSLGRQVRLSRLNANCPLVFLTSRSIISLDLFSLKPKEFLLKPISSEFLLPLVDSVRRTQLIKTLTIRQGRESIQLAQSDIFLLESRGPVVLVHTRRACYRTYCKLSDFTLAYPFVRIHQSFVVNLAYVAEIRSTCMILFNDREVSISRRYRPKVNQLSLIIG